MKSLTIRVPDEEHALMQAVAAKRFMTITGVVRAHFHTLFEADGLTGAPEAAEPETPRVIRRPIPQGVNAWRDEIYVRMNSGESAADIAESYGVSAQLVKDKYKAAKDDKQYHIDAGLPVPPLAAPSEYTPPADTPPDDEPELVYDPVDPDNPTEEEQATHAEIARRRMIALGFKL